MFYVPKFISPWSTEELSPRTHVCTGALAFTHVGAGLTPTLYPSHQDNCYKTMYMCKPTFRDCNICIGKIWDW